LKKKAGVAPYFFRSNDTEWKHYWDYALSKSTDDFSPIRKNPPVKFLFSSRRELVKRFSMTNDDLISNEDITDFDEDLLCRHVSGTRLRTTFSGRNALASNIFTSSQQSFSEIDPILTQFSPLPPKERPYKPNLEPIEDPDENDLHSSLNHSKFNTWKAWTENYEQNSKITKEEKLTAKRKSHFQVLFGNDDDEREMVVDERYKEANNTKELSSKDFRPIIKRKVRRYPLPLRRRIGKRPILQS